MPLTELLQYDLPLWVVMILGLIQNIQNISKLWTGIRRFRLWPIANRSLKRGIRQWLDVNKTVYLPQEEYDLLTEKEDNTVYLISERTKR